MLGGNVDHLVIDNFLDGFDAFRKECDNKDFSGMTNPVDGVFYPGINADIPAHIQDEITNKVSAAIGKRAELQMAFLRLSPKGTSAPHQAHNDAVMASYGMIIYMNNAMHCDGGTAFVDHKETSMEYGPTSNDQLAVWEKDNGDRDKWSVIDMCEMKENRALLFNSAKMHRSEPIGGFGSNNVDGRLVMCCFLN